MGGRPGPRCGSDGHLGTGTCGRAVTAAGSPSREGEAAALAEASQIRGSPRSGAAAGAERPGGVGGRGLGHPPVGRGETALRAARAAWRLPSGSSPAAPLLGLPAWGAPPAPAGEWRPRPGRGAPRGRAAFPRPGGLRAARRGSAGCVQALGLSCGCCTRGNIRRPPSMLRGVSFQVPPDGGCPCGKDFLLLPCPKLTLSSSSLGTSQYRPAQWGWCSAHKRESVGSH